MKTPNVQLLRDLVLIRAMSLELNKSAGGVIIPGDLDKMAPKRALVVATGPGTYNKKGEFVEAPCKAGDVILYMERDLIPVKLEGEDFYIVPASEVLLKLAAAPVDNEALRLAIEAKFIRLPLDNASDHFDEKIFRKSFAARRYPQKRWKTSG